MVEVFEEDSLKNLKTAINAFITTTGPSKVESITFESRESSYKAILLYTP